MGKVIELLKLPRIRIVKNNAILGVKLMEILLIFFRDHTLKMLEGAMKNPQVMIPRLIERMRQKDVEWRKNQEVCNRIWREETEKHYAKSLDHQAVIFKQNDLKLLRAKTIVSQFENLYDEVKCFTRIGS